MDSQLSVVISSPTHTPHKFTLELSRQCTILELKEIIVTRLDTKLTIADQRLIFGGRILDDKDTLDRVFEKVDCSSISPTIHLVVSHRHDTGQTQQQQTTLHTTTTPTSPAPLRFRGNSDNTPSSASTNTNTAATSGTDLNGIAFTPFTTTTPAGATVTGARDGRTETDASNSATNTTTAYSPFPFTTTAGGVPLMVPMAPQAMQYVLVNGMPYLVPAVYLPMLHYQQMQQTYGQLQFLPDGTPFLPSFQNMNNINSNINNPIADQARAGAALAAETPQQNAQEIAARDQRRAASLWLLMKLAFGIYLFGQNGSIERLVLLHIAALVIFLHQTGRLRIVRRIVQNPPAEDAAQGAANPVPGAAAAPQPTQTTTSTSTTTTTTTSTSTSGSADRSASTANSSSVTNTQHATTSTSESSTTQQQQQQGGDAQAQETVAAATEAAQPRVSPWRSLEHALLTFVTSLVPAPQPDIDPAVAAAAAAGDRGM
ncbi:MAG: hypothetical protein JOS17DRAFT_753114 [Linnemannia elongata]|nr:MAG: hypothetical protein JOS17DRAFT_753114 [Linnemannia elongata]